MARILLSKKIVFQSNLGKKVYLIETDLEEHIFFCPAVMSNLKLPIVEWQYKNHHADYDCCNDE